MTLSPVDHRLAALWEHRQIEIVGRCDLIAAAVGRLVDRARNAMVAEVVGAAADYNTFRRIERIYRGIIPELVAYMNAVLPGLVRYADNDARRRLARVVPRRWWKVKFPGLIEAAPAGRDPLDKLFGPKNFSIGVEPAIKGKVSSAEFRKLLDEMLLPPLTETQVEEIVKSPNPNTGDPWEKRLTDLSSKVTQPERVAGEIITGMATGEDVKALRDRIDKHVGKLHGSSMRIARTEARRVAETANREALKQSLGDMLDGWQITAVLDERTRPEHAARHGTVYRKGGQPAFEDAPELPDEPNCVLPGNLVRGMFSGGLKARYTGKAVKITVASGRSLEVTPNHPVLTEYGFIRAGHLNRGDKLLRYSGKIELPIVVPNDEYQKPTSIENVYDTLTQSNARFCGKATGLNLHGDGKFIKGNVDIVSVVGQLLLDGNTMLDERGYETAFVWRYMQSSPKPRFGPLPLRSGIVSLSTPSRPCGLTLTAPPVGPLSKLMPFHPLCVGAIAKRDAVLRQRAPETMANNAGFYGQLLEAIPGVVAADEVIDIETFEVDCHVYDLQSVNGWYWCNDIIIHNCRCTLVPVLKTPDEAVAQRFANASSGRIPDPVAYDDWFRQADERRRRIAVGSRRYDLVKAQKPAGVSPEWSDFIGSDGKLIPTKTLKAGPSAERKGEVMAMLAQRRSDFLAITQAPFIPTAIRPLPSPVAAVVSLTAQQQRQMKRLAKRIVTGEIPKPSEQIRLARAIAPGKTDAELRQLIDLAIAGFFGGR